MFRRRKTDFKGPNIDDWIVDREIFERKEVEGFPKRGTYGEVSVCEREDDKRVVCEKVMKDWKKEHEQIKKCFENEVNSQTKCFHYLLFRDSYFLGKLETI